MRYYTAAAYYGYRAAGNSVQPIMLESQCLQTHHSIRHAPWLQTQEKEALKSRTGPILKQPSRSAPLQPSISIYCYTWNLTWLSRLSSRREKSLIAGRDPRWETASLAAGRGRRNLSTTRAAPPFCSSGAAVAASLARHPRNAAPSSSHTCSRCHCMRSGRAARCP